MPASFVFFAGGGVIRCLSPRWLFFLNLCRECFTAYVVFLFFSFVSRLLDNQDNAPTQYDHPLIGRRLRGPSSWPWLLMQGPLADAKTTAWLCPEDTNSWFKLVVCWTCDEPWEIASKQGKQDYQTYTQEVCPDFPERAYKAWKLRPIGLASII